MFVKGNNCEELQPGWQIVSYVQVPTHPISEWRKLVTYKSGYVRAISGSCITQDEFIGLGMQAHVRICMHAPYLQVRSYRSRGSGAV